MAQELGPNPHGDLPEKVLSAVENSVQKIRETFLEALGNSSANERLEFVGRVDEIINPIFGLVRNGISSIRSEGSDVFANRLNTHQPERFLEILGREGHPTHRLKEAVRQISSCIYHTKKRCADEIGISPSHLVNWLNDKTNFSEETERRVIDWVHRILRDRILRGRQP